MSTKILTSLLFLAPATLCFMLLQATGKQVDSTSSARQPKQQVLDQARLETDKARLVTEAESLSMEQLTKALAALRPQVEEESRWAQFLDWTMWYTRDSCDRGAHERWKSSWSTACNDLHAQTILLMSFLNEPLVGDVHRARTVYVEIAAVLPQLHEARLKISRGVLVDVYNLPPGSSRLGAW